MDVTILRRNARRALVVLAVLGMFAMWTYALGFSPRESINRVYDDEWALAAAAVCDEATAQRDSLADYRTIGELGPEGLSIRADAIEQASAILSRMVDRLEKLPRATEKGRALLPQWLADWRTYLEDRAAYVERLRAGDNSPFAETDFEGLPLSERIATFATDNLVPSCSPPRDLSL